MLWIKCCPRCLGDMFLESDPDGPEWVCIQCGNRCEGRREEAAQGSFQPVVLAAGSKERLDQRERRFDRAVDKAPNVKISALGVYASLVILAGLLGWMGGAGGFVTSDHRTISLFAGIVAPLSVLGTVALATLRRFVNAPTSSLWVGSGAVQAYPAGGPAPFLTNEPSHIHIPRPAKGSR